MKIAFDLPIVAPYQFGDKNEKADCSKMKFMTSCKIEENHISNKIVKISHTARYTLLPGVMTGKMYSEVLD